MRINFSPAKVTQKPAWFKVLIREFCGEYDIKFGNLLLGYLETPSGARTFVAWIRSQGFKAEYWCLEPFVYDDTDRPGRKLTKYLAFGVIIDDHCPKMMEYKLRHT